MSIASCQPSANVFNLPQSSVNYFSFHFFFWQSKNLVNWSVCRLHCIFYHLPQFYVDLISWNNSVRTFLLWEIHIQLTSAELSCASNWSPERLHSFPYHILYESTYRNTTLIYCDSQLRVSCSKSDLPLSDELQSSGAPSNNLTGKWNRSREVRVL